MKRTQLLKHLRKNGCTLLTEGEKHSKWINLADHSKQTTVPRHTEIDDYWDHRDEIQRDMQAESDLVPRLRQQSVSPLAEKLAATNG